MSPTAATVFLGLGGNQGDRLACLRRGAQAVAALPGVRALAGSGVWESEYVGDGDGQPDYLNACLEIVTELAPRALLAALQGIERDCGRAPATHLLPRPLDLDILLYDGLVVDEPGLVIPHPRLRERAFVLEPLGELAADRELPDSGLTVDGVRAMIRAAGGPWVRPLAGVELFRDGNDA